MFASEHKFNLVFDYGAIAASNFTKASSTRARRRFGRRRSRLPRGTTREKAPFSTRKFYQTVLETHLSPTQYLTLQLLKQEFRSIKKNRLL
ncbi:MAG: hypothetical protein SVX43_00680 [Cyanobacteriota bacterium]|nr:hypothetical protein [Cyanobacteriota bacterium]